MEADPPPQRCTDQGVDEPLSVVTDLGSAVIEVTVRGRWSRLLSLEAYAALRECIRAYPTAVIIDLSGLHDLDAASASMWLAASRAVKVLQPPPQLVLCIPPTRRLATRLRRLGAVRFLPMYATMGQARAALAGQLPIPDHLSLNRLRPGPGSARVAAGMVAAGCTAWHLPALRAPAEQIMAELVANAVEHAGTEMALIVSLRGQGLHLAVHDGEERPPCLRSPAAGSSPAARGHGLRMVDASASAWGCVRTANGKVVWAIVAPGGPSADGRTAT
jgi:hypothetical protein